MSLHVPILSHSFPFAGACSIFIGLNAWNKCWPRAMLSMAESFQQHLYKKSIEQDETAKNARRFLIIAAGWLFEGGTTKAVQ